MLSPEASDERQYYRDVVLEQRLTAAIQRLNPCLSDDNLRKVVRDLRLQGVEHPTLIETNQTLWETLVNHISVDQDLGSGRRGQTVRIIDFDTPDNNDFLCVSQFKVEGLHQNIVPYFCLSCRTIGNARIG
jgi:type I restriction enzyme, R subunit